MNMWNRTCFRRAGFTLVEVLIAMAIIVIGVAGLTQTFSLIQRAMQFSKNRTLAANLAQEKMQILKQKPYYQILITSDPEHNDADFAPEVIDYDPGFFPPELIVEGGVPYTRYTYIEAVRENSGVLEPIGVNTPDTGMKRVTVTVTWGTGAGGKRKVVLRSVISNPDTVMNNAAFNGVVRSTSGLAIPGALVGLVEAVGYSDTSDSVGQYRISATPGTYSMQASAAGYFPALVTVTVSAGGTVNTDFALRKMAVGTVMGFPWLENNLLISQVVGSSVSIDDAYSQEYVEVFNPTTYTWTMSGAVGLKFQRGLDSAKRTIQIDYISSEVDTKSYYLFANTGTVVIGGVAVNADAVWSSTNPVSDFPLFGTQSNVIPVAEDGGNEGGGALELYKVSNGAVVDRVGWNKSGTPAHFFETTAIQQTIGLSQGEAYFRKTSTADVSGVSQLYGPAYDSDNNSVDFYGYPSGVPYPPRNAFSSVAQIISGKPAVGAVATCTDGLSASAEAVSMGNPPYAYFSLPNVATGYWSVSIASSVYTVMQTTVSLLTQGAQYVFPSTATMLTTQADTGIITGRVVNAVGSSLSNIIVNAGASTANTDSNGRYRLTGLSGTVDVLANPAVGGNATYVNASSVSINISPGEMHGGVDFVLYQGGRLRGFVTRDGTNGLPGVSVSVFDANNVARDVQVTDGNGRFTSVVLSTGYYVAQPVLSTLEDSEPQQATATITMMGGTVFSATFTISGALGAISGTVKSGGQPIKTGVLIAVTTMTLAGTPPALPDISAASLNGAPIYLTSSLESGSYNIEVRGSTNPAYSVYAYYPITGSTGTVLYSTKTTGVPVTAGQTYSGVNFSW